MLVAAVHPSSESEESPLRSEPTRPNLLGIGISVKGQVTSHDDLYIDGAVEGSIEAKASTVTIGPHATISASIIACNVIVLGTVEGSITALGKLDLRKTCKLTGQVVTSRLAIEDGAHFKGSINIVQPAAQASAAGDRSSKLVA